MNPSGRRVSHLPVVPAGWTLFAPTPERQPPSYAALLTGASALERLALLSEVQARQVLSVCAATLSLYPAWERRDWMMPEPEAALRAYGGRFLNLNAVAARLGNVRHVPGRQSYLHAPSGLTFAAHQSAVGSVTLLLGGANSSHSDRQMPTVSAEVKQMRANVLNLVGRVPRLYRAADLLTLLVRDSVKGELSVGGHSMGGGLAQYAGLANGLQVLAFSPTALGRGVLALLSQSGKLADGPKVLEQVQSFSLEGDPIPRIGTRWFHAHVVGFQLRLPLFPGIAPAKHVTSHGQIYSHLLAQLQQVWPHLPSALETGKADSS
jgi:hypothetical protein